MKLKNYILSALFICSSFPLLAQNAPDLGSIHGSMQSDVQYTQADSAIGAQTDDGKVVSNTYLLLTYQKGKFETGVRYEMYLNPLLGGFDGYKGQGIPYRYAAYHGDFIDVTVGNFYEQFGNGTIFRAYQAWNLGVDNSIDGVRLKIMPKKGITLTGLIGKQRVFWRKSNANVRAADLDLQLNDAITALNKSKLRLSLGASMVSTFEPDDNPDLKLPQNVSAFAGRTTAIYKGFRLDAEGAYKINDPSFTNEYVYNTGNSMYVCGSYAKKGIGFTTSVRRADNMSFRSERDASFNIATLSFLPPVTRAHTYRLPTLYPYATQLNGEFGLQSTLYFKIKKGTKLGGHYGWQIAINYSRVNGLDTTHVMTKVNDTTSQFSRIYKTSFFGSPKKHYFEDFNIEINKKWTKDFKTTLTYIYLVYDRDVIESGGNTRKYGVAYSHMGVLETNYQINDKNAIRFELQHLYTKNDRGSWAMALVEYSVSPHWYFTAFDEWNYGNTDPKKRFHYPNFTVAYVKDAHRISVGYARQREGLLCVGGICRAVPAFNGFGISLTTGF